MKNNFLKIIHYTIYLIIQIKYLKKSKYLHKQIKNLTLNNKYKFKTKMIKWKNNFFKIAHLTIQLKFLKR